MKKAYTFVIIFVVITFVIAFTWNILRSNNESDGILHKYSECNSEKVNERVAEYLAKKKLITYYPELIDFDIVKTEIIYSLSGEQRYYVFTFGNKESGDIQTALLNYFSAKEAIDKLNSQGDYNSSVYLNERNRLLNQISKFATITVGAKKCYPLVYSHYKSINHYDIYRVEIIKELYANSTILLGKIIFPGVFEILNKDGEIMGYIGQEKKVFTAEEVEDLPVPRESISTPAQNIQKWDLIESEYLSKQ